MVTWTDVSTPDLLDTRWHRGALWRVYTRTRKEFKYFKGRHLETILSNLNACLISSSRSSWVSLSFIITVNSEKSSLPLWSTSISFMMFNISSSVGLRPSVRISTPNSFALMKPSPFWKRDRSMSGKMLANCRTGPAWHSIQNILKKRLIWTQLKCRPSAQ